MKDGLRTLLMRYARPIKFVISGGTAAATGLTILYLCTGIFGIWYLYSTWVAFVGAFIVSFLMQKFWTFGDRSVQGLRGQLSSYFAVALSNLTLNTVSMYILVEYVHLHYLIAQICTTGVLASVSYFVYRGFIFARGVEHFDASTA